MKRPAIALILGLLYAGGAVAADNIRTTHALSLFDSVKYGPDFSHFEYVNPDAPKGGQLRMEAIGTFDTLNPFVLKGSAAIGLGLVYDTLLTSSQDEASTSYGLLVESIELPDDLSSVVFKLREEARWHDGKPITPADVIFSFNALKEKGVPLFRYYYANVVSADELPGNKVKFSFSGGVNRELPSILGQLPVLPKHYWEGREFDATTLEPPLGSGPYRIAGFEAGRAITYERVPDYWGRDLAVNKGRHNYDRIRFDYYRDRTISLEAFKSHGLDFRNENSAKTWATQYAFPAARDGRVIVETLTDNSPAGMQGFVYNTRRPKFQDPRVRQALAHAFDFEWSNKNIFYDQYIRTRSYFENSEMAATGLPSAAELKYLEPLKGQIPDEVFTAEYQPPVTDGSGNNRRGLRTANKLLQDAGWRITDGKLTNTETGEVMTIEFLITQANSERTIAPMIRNLKRLGVEANIRLIDTSQYRNRLDQFDFDIVTSWFRQSLSPGNEQRDFWGSETADRPGSRNLIGIKDPAIDRLIEQVIAAPNRDELVAATRALDRVLQWQHFMIPQFHLNKYRIAYWDRFGRPEIKPKYGLGFSDTWWIDPAKDTAMQAKKAAARE